MNQPIVSVAAEPHAAQIVSDPTVEGIVQEQIGQNGTDHAPYAKGNFQFERVITGWREQTVLDLRRKK